MLILGAKLEDEILVHKKNGDLIATIKVVGLTKSQAKLGFNAPHTVEFTRANAVNKERKQRQ